MKKTTILLSVLLLTTFAHANGLEDYSMGPGMMGWSRNMAWFTHALMIAAWIVVIVGIIAIFRWWVRSKSVMDKRVDPEDSAVDILKRRYAKGEIDKDEFEEKKKILEE
jgi:putative membrane protein